VIALDDGKPARVTGARPASGVLFVVERNALLFPALPKIAYFAGHSRL
jgi:hypothetical protein